MTSDTDNEAFGDEGVASVHDDGGSVASVASEKMGDDYKVEANTLTRKAEAEDEENEVTPYGWFSFRPKFLQGLNNSVGFLTILSIFASAQSMTVTGLVYVVITTIERRFNLTSLKTGLIAAMYDISSMAVIIFITYFGENGNKPVWIGTGAVLFGLGSLLFSVPHFATDLYEPGSTEAEFCGSNINGTSSEDCRIEDDENLSRYFGVFIAAQCLHGLGASALYTLGQAYIDENVISRKVPKYIGIFQALASFFPALGFVFGGIFLSIYTDIRADTSELDIDPSSPVWVGAWWLGFILTGSVSILISVWVIGFPAQLPGHAEVVKSRVNEAQKGSDFTVRAGFGNSLWDFPRAAWTLLKNPPFMFLNAGVTLEWFILAAIAVFGPKFLENQFSLSSGTAAVITGVLVVPSTLIGCGVGAWAVTRFELNFQGQLKFIFGSLVVSFISMFVFASYCPNANLAGVNIPYNDGYISEDVNVTSLCNVGCYCEDKFDPVCGPDDVMYYSACHAGCVDKMEIDDSTVYTDCSCFPEEPNDAVGGRCDTSCKLLPLYCICVFIMLTFSFLPLVPGVTATFRVVDFSQRAFAIGLQSLLIKVFGSIPGPIVFGALIDKTCLIWEYDCEGGETCWLYENKQFAHYTLIMIISCRVVSLCCFAASYATHRPATEDDKVSLASKADKTDDDGDGGTDSDVKVNHLDIEQGQTVDEEGPLPDDHGKVIEVGEL